MGWSSATNIFDSVAKELDSVFGYVSSPIYSEEDLKLRVLNSLLKELEYHDWDTHQESKYWKDPIIGRLLGNTFEDDDYDTEDREDEDWFFSPNDGD